jgi:hypothetical protein
MWFIAVVALVAALHLPVLVPSQLPVIAVVALVAALFLPVLVSIVVSIVCALVALPLGLVGGAALVVARLAEWGSHRVPPLLWAAYVFAALGRSALAPYFFLTEFGKEFFEQWRARGAHPA